MLFDGEASHPTVVERAEIEIATVVRLVRRSIAATAQESHLR